MSRKQVQVLDVLGERVSLVPTEIPESESYLVSFTQKYVPENTSDKDIESMKTVFRKIFLNPKFNVDNTLPLPPCNEQDKKILTKTFQRRLELLTKDIANEKKRDEDTVRLRQLSGFADRIQRFLEQIGCHQYKKASTEPIEELDDDRIKRLLKQFVFLLLQGQHPIEAYENILPAPREFIDNLESNPIDDFDGFLKSYRDEQHPIAARIAKVLEVAELDLNAIQAEIDAGMVAKINVIIGDIRKIYPEPSFWEGLIPKDNSRIDMRAVFDKLLQRLQEKDRELQEKDLAMQQLEAEKKACEAKLQENEDLIGILKGRITNLEAELSKAKEAANAKGTQSDNLKTAMEQGQAELEIYKQTIAGLKAENKALNEKYIGLEQRLKALEEEIKRLRGVIEGLEAKNKELAGLEDINKQLSEELESLRKVAQEKTALQEQLTAITEALDKCNADKKILEEQGAAKDSEISSLRTRVADLENEITSLTQQKTAADAELAAVRAQCDQEKQGMIQRHEKELNDATGATDELQRQHNAEKAEMEKRHADAIAAAEATVQGLQGRIRELESQVSSLEGEKTGLQDQIAELRADINDKTGEFSKKIQNLVTEKASLESEKQALTEQISIVKKNSNVKAARITALESRVLELEGQLKKKTDEASSLVQQIDALNTEITRLREEIARQQASLGEKDAEIARQQSTIGEKDDELQGLQTAIGEKDTEIARQQGTIGEKDAEIARQQANLATLTQERDAKITELLQKDQQIESLESTIKQLKGQIIEKDNRIQALEESLEEIRGKLTEKEQQIQTLQAQVADLTGKIKTLGEDTSSELGQLRKSLQEKTFQLEAITRERDEMKAKATELISQIQGLGEKLKKISSDAEEKLRKAKEDCDAKLNAVEEKLAEALAREGKKNTNAAKAATEMSSLLEQQKQKILELEGLQEKSLQSISGLQGERDALLAEKVELQKKIQALEQQIKEMAEKIQSILGNTKTQTDQLTSQLQAKEAEKEAISKELAEALQKLKESTDAILKLNEDHRKAIGAQKTDYEMKLLDKDGVIGKQRLDITNLGAALTKAGEETAALQQTIVKLQQANEALNTEIQRLREQLEAKEGVEDQLRACQEAKKALEERATASELEAAKLVELKAQIDALNKTISELQAAKEALETKAGEEKQEAEAQIAEKVQAMASLDAEIQRLNAELEEAHLENKKLQTKCQETIRIMEEENAALKEKVSALEAELQQSKADHLAFVEKTKEETEAALGTLANIQSKYEKLQASTQEIISWLEKESPEDTFALDLPEDDPLQKLLQSVKTILSRKTSIVSSDDEKRTEMSTQRSFCYLMYFTSQLWSTYFPFIPHDKGAEEYRKQFNFRLILDRSLYSPFFLDELFAQISENPMGKQRELNDKYRVEAGNHKGLYERIKESILKQRHIDNMNTLDRLANKKLIDVLVKVLAAMQEIMYSKENNVYFMQFARDPILDKSAGEEEIFMIIDNVLREQIHLVYKDGIAQCTNEIKAYVKYFAPQTQKEQTETFVWMVRNPLDESRTPVIVSGAGNKVPKDQMSFSSDPELDVFLRDKRAKAKVAVSDTTINFLSEHKHMNYSLLLFLFIFAMRDYLHYYEGYGGKCPVPYFLQRKQLLDPPPTATVRPVAIHPHSAAVPAALAAKAPVPEVLPTAWASPLDKLRGSNPAQRPGGK